MMEPIGDPRAVAIQNNFLLAGRGPDLAFVGKNSASLKSWSINHNGRQVRAPDSAATEASEWIPSSDDVVLDKNELMSFDPQDNDFLRPAKDSPLATAGAGDGLPEYVGAVPPEGVDPWDWDRTWRAWATKPRDTQPK
jgi:hypothetical protein